MDSVSVQLGIIYRITSALPVTLDAQLVFQIVLAVLVNLHFNFIMGSAVLHLVLHVLGQSVQGANKGIT